MRFENGHSQPLCTPTRVKLMTGLHNYAELPGVHVPRPGRRHLRPRAGAGGLPDGDLGQVAVDEQPLRGPRGRLAAAGGLRRAPAVAAPARGARLALLGADPGDERPQGNLGRGRLRAGPHERLRPRGDRRARGGGSGHPQAALHLLPDGVAPRSVRHDASSPGRGIERGTVRGDGGLHGPPGGPGAGEARRARTGTRHTAAVHRRQRHLDPDLVDPRRTGGSPAARDARSRPEATCPTWPGGRARSRPGR